MPQVTVGTENFGDATAAMPRALARSDSLTFVVQCDRVAALDYVATFGRTDFRHDVAKVTVPTLLIHGDSDGMVPFDVSGKRSAEAIAGSELVVIKDGPHGINASHASEFNEALLAFLAR